MGSSSVVADYDKDAPSILRWGASTEMVIKEEERLYERTPGSDSALGTVWTTVALDSHHYEGGGFARRSSSGTPGLPHSLDRIFFMLSGFNLRVNCSFYTDTCGYSSPGITVTAHRPETGVAEGWDRALEQASRSALVQSPCHQQQG